jgi:TonB family protein
MLHPAPQRRQGSPALVLAVLGAGLVAGMVGLVFFLVMPSEPPRPTVTVPPSVPPMVAPAMPAGPVQVGMPMQGVFSPGLPTLPTGHPYMDYQLAVTTPGQYQIDLVSSSTSAYDPTLRLLSGGQELGYNDDTDGLNSRLSMQLLPGQYTVRVSKFGSSQVNGPVAFTLTVSLIAPAPGAMTGAAPSASASAGAPTVRGSLPREVIARAMRRQMGPMRRCYEAGLRRNPAMGGQVTVRFVISPQGRVSSASVTSSTLGDRATESCISRAVRAARFPPPTGGGVVMVTYPISFR